MVDLTFLGAGSAFTVSGNNFHSNILIHSREKNFLIGCGSDIRFSLYDQGFDFNDIDALYLTHLHADQVGGLEWLAFTRMFASKKPKPRLYIRKDLADVLWDQILSGGLKSIEGVDVNLSTYFDVVEIPSQGSFTWENLKFTVLSTDNLFEGLMIDTPESSIYFSGALKVLDHDMKNVYQKAGTIFHACESVWPSDKTFLTHYENLCVLPVDVRNKMWLYYYKDGTLPNAKEEGFKGFVRRGQRFSL